MNKINIPTYVRYDQFDPERVCCGDVKDRTIPYGPSKGTPYGELPIFYNYETNDKTVPFIRGPLRIEFCRLESNGGLILRKSANDDGKEPSNNTEKEKENKNKSISVDLIPSGETKILREKLAELYNKCVTFITKPVAMKAKATGFKSNDPSSTGFADFVTLQHALDKNTGEVREGIPPRIYLKPRGMEAQDGKPQFGFVTRFFDLNEQVIPHSRLENAKLTFVPIVEFSRLYLGNGKIRMQFHIHQAIVLECIPLNSEPLQKETISHFKKLYGYPEQEGNGESKNTSTPDAPSIEGLDKFLSNNKVILS